MAQQLKLECIIFLLFAIGFGTTHARRGGSEIITCYKTEEACTESCSDGFQCKYDEKCDGPANLNTACKLSDKLTYIIVGVALVVILCVSIIACCCCCKCCPLKQAMKKNKKSRKNQVMHHQGQMVTTTGVYNPAVVRPPTQQSYYNPAGGRPPTQQLYNNPAGGRPNTQQLYYTTGM
uniref:Uncharacterized protein n=1 Tax=Plectus sambesii TaxID=2011161 RepID=A0A914XEU8_9BILA